MLEPNKVSHHLLQGAGLREAPLLPAHGAEEDRVQRARGAHAGVDPARAEEREEGRPEVPGEARAEMKGCRSHCAE